MTPKYACSYVIDRQSISIFEVRATHSERTVIVATRPGVGWEIDLPIWNFPSVGILPARTIAVWSVTRLYLLAEGGEAARIDLDDEIHGVYSVFGNLCIVCELSVLLYDPEHAVVLERFDADDVLGECWWEGDRLWVDSFSGEPLEFVPTAQGLGYLGPP